MDMSLYSVSCWLYLYSLYSFTTSLTSSYDHRKVWVLLIKKRLRIKITCSRFSISLVFNMTTSLFQDRILPLLGEDPTEAVNWLKGKNLIAHTMQCPTCNTPMHWQSYPRAIDKYVWRCLNKECAKHKCRISIRHGSFYAGSKLPLQTWVHAMFLWCEEVGAQKSSKILGISMKSIVDVWSFFREVCENHFITNPIHLGGHGVIVEIDESLFSHKPKHHRGRSTKSEQWVFGLADTSVKPCVGYMEIVESRSAENLLPIIKRVARPGSVIHSDQWRAYTNITRDIGLAHHTVNHSLNFVDPVTGVHTQTIESYWNRQKSKIKTMRGCRRNFLNSYLQEFMWRERYSSNALDNLCNHIASKYILH